MWLLGMPQFALLVTGPELYADQGKEKSENFVSWKRWVRKLDNKTALRTL